MSLFERFKVKKSASSEEPYSPEGPFRSTRGNCFATAPEAVLKGLAPDGGLYVDPDIGKGGFDVQGCLALDPFGQAEKILSRLLPGFDHMDELVAGAYDGRFASSALTPLVPVGEDWVLELFHGPTAAFKDVALCMLPQLMTAARGLTGTEEKTVILTATSGDTGKAALEGFHDVPGTGIIVFFPHGGVSSVQEAQMLTQVGANVAVCAVRGNFDDCQSAVKQVFSDPPSVAGVSLSSANSINIGRLAPQVVYYFLAYAELMKRGRISFGERVDYVVPTGNFGDILAGWYAKQLGLPVGRLVCASNANRVLTDFLTTGVYDRRREFFKTNSPSMDILVSSNLERLLYYAAGGDTQAVKNDMLRLQNSGYYKIPAGALDYIRKDFSAFCCDEKQTLLEIRRCFEATGYLPDTHTAVALHAAGQYKKERSSGAPVVVLSTASPFKFPEAVLRALGETPEGDAFAQMEQLSRVSGIDAPASLSGLRGKEILHRDVIDRAEISDYVRRKLSEV
ncbi:MAG: threonine synthase [Oscillospiraceae bacterium]|nr:threonine synthase [Oscillospiraceae bacterium]